MEYALRYLKDEVCEFLVNKGADVDAVEPLLDLDLYGDDDDENDVVV